MSCNQGNLSTIREPSTPEECGCECDMTDLTYTGASYTCADVSPGNGLDVVVDRILDKLCEIDSDTTVSAIEFDCIPNTTAPTGGTVKSTLQWFADQIIPKSGNDCNCPITNNLYFTDTYGIVQCDGGQDSGYLKFNGDYANLNADTQARVLADLKIDNGFGAGYVEISSNVDLSVVNTDQLNYSYGIDATGASRTLSLSQIAAASLDHKNRRFCVRRLDCTVANTVTIQAYIGETIEGAASITLGVGHGYIIHADDATNDWVIVAEYFGGCDAIEQQNDGDIYMAYNLGVGTSNPTAKLHINNTDTSLVTAKLINSGASAVDMLQVSINGTVVDVIDEEGNAAFGVSTPLARLHSKGEGTTSATYSLIAEDSSASDHLTVRDDGEVVIRSEADKRFQFNSTGIGAITDAGVIRDWTLTGATCTLSHTRFITANTNLSPQYAASAKFFAVTVTATDSAGTNDIKIFDVIPTYNLNTLATGNTVGFNYTPTLTATLGNNYGFISGTAGVRNGFGTTTPLSLLESGGSFGVKIQTVSTNTTLDITHSTVLVDTTSGSVTITLPAAATCTNRIYTIKKIIAANTCTIDGNGAELIDGSATVAMSNQYAVRMIQSNGSAWYILSSI